MDGLMIKKDRYNVKILNELSEIVKNTFDIKVSFSEKEMK
jgi:hypothetical protein